MQEILNKKTLKFSYKKMDFKRFNLQNVKLFVYALTFFNMEKTQVVEILP